MGNIVPPDRTTGAVMADGEIRHKRGDMLVGTLHQEYWPNFVPGVRLDMRLNTLLEQSGAESLTDIEATTSRPKEQNMARRRIVCITKHPTHQDKYHRITAGAIAQLNRIIHRYVGQKTGMIDNILMHNNDHKRSGFRSFKLERALRITDSASFLAEGCAIFEKTNLIARRRLIECSVNDSSFDTRCNELPRNQQHESGYENDGEPGHSHHEYRSDLVFVCLADHSDRFEKTASNLLLAGKQKEIARVSPRPIEANEEKSRIACLSVSLLKLRINVLASDAGYACL